MLQVLNHLLSLYVTTCLSIEPFGHVVEADPTFTGLNVFELLHNFLFGVTGTLHGLPELNELFRTNFTVVVHVDLRKELFGRDPAKGTFPVFHGLGLVNSVATIDVKDAKNFVHLSLAFGGQFLKLDKDKNISDS